MDYSNADLGQTLSVAIYARRLRVSENKVRDWIRSGQLGAIDIASHDRERKPRWRIPLDEVAKFERARFNSKGVATSC